MLSPGRWLVVTLPPATPTSVVQWTGSRENRVASFRRGFGTSRIFTFIPGQLEYASTYHAGSRMKRASPAEKFDADEAKTHAEPVHRSTRIPEEFPSNRIRTRYPAEGSGTVTTRTPPVAVAFLYPCPAFTQPSSSRTPGTWYSSRRSSDPLPTYVVCVHGTAAIKSIWIDFSKRSFTFRPALEGSAS